MFQPFELVEPLYISKLLSVSRRYLVTQTCSCGLQAVDTTKPTPIIVSGYEEYGLAAMHMNTLINDRLRGILDLQDSNHLKLILDMIEGSRYLVYRALTSDPRLPETQISSELVQVNLRISQEAEESVGG